MVNQHIGKCPHCSVYNVIALYFLTYIMRAMHWMPAVQVHYRRLIWPKYGYTTDHASAVKVHAWSGRLADE